MAENGRRGKQDSEYELLDTGIFDEDRYFDVVVEYAKAAHDDILMRVTAHNRGPDAATLHVLPTLWFRNTWSRRRRRSRRSPAAVAHHPELGEWRFETDGELWYCENETGSKAAINDHLIHGGDAARPSGTKCAAHHRARGRPRASRARSASGSPPAPTAVDFDAVFATRIEEADAFYATVIPATLDADQTLVMRQALAGLLWGKQYYEYDVHRWLREHGVNPWDAGRAGRPQRAAGSTWSPATSSRCRTSGSTRGSRPGTWRSTARRCRWSTSTSPRSRSSCCCTRATCTPTARSRRTSGTSPTSTRR